VGIEQEVSFSDRTHFNERYFRTMNQWNQWRRKRKKISMDILVTVSHASSILTFLSALLNPKPRIRNKKS
jgi:hypothetical protein